MSLRKVLILRKQFRKKADELKTEKERQKINELTDEVKRLEGAVCSAIFKLSKENEARFDKIVKKDANAFVRKMGSKLWT